MALERPTLRKIRKLAEEIGERFRPQKVILFGSWASGRPSSDSDVDIMVIMDSPFGSLRQAALISRSLDHAFPLDIVVKSPEEVRRRAEQGDPFIKEVMSRGRVLYEADNP
jgi:predicted nucleotidyltransferase